MNVDNDESYDDLRIGDILVTSWYGIDYVTFAPQSFLMVEVRALMLPSMHRLVKATDFANCPEMQHVVANMNSCRSWTLKQ